MAVVRVGIVMGSDSDWPKIKAAAAALDEFGIPYEVRVMSAHRTPHVVADYATTAIERGLGVIIAAAGGAADRLAGVKRGRREHGTQAGGHDRGTRSAQE